MFGYSEDQIVRFGLTFGVTAFTAVHGVHHPQLARGIEGGKFGTFVLLLGLGVGLIGFAAKGLIGSSLGDRRVSAQACAAWYDDALAFVTGTLFITIGVSMFTHAGLLTGGTAGLAFRALRHRHRLRAAVLRDQPAPSMRSLGAPWAEPSHQDLRRGDAAVDAHQRSALGRLRRYRPLVSPPWPAGCFGFGLPRAVSPPRQPRAG